ncbi:MHS family MFS transporter [Thioclava sp. BHET1]|nr:MHS family MFS transporter [Thioclava sp. BHET1]
MHYPSPRVSRRAAAAAMIGTAIEWYDFFIFGTASALVFGKLFFPNETSFIGVLSSFGIFAVGFVARPLGGFIFGHLGDRIGRKATLVTTLLLMGIATTLIGLLPTAASIGGWAPVLLVVLRLLQGFAVGGEWGGSALVSVENAPPEARGRFGAFTQMGNGVGVALSTGAFALASALPTEQFLLWGWRLPFLASAVLVIVGLVIRLKMDETPDFAEMQRTNTLAARPVQEALATSRRAMFIVAGLKFSESVYGFLILTFLLSYASHDVGMDKGVLLWANVIGAILSIGVFYAFGVISDRIGRRATFIFSALVVIISAFPMFWVVQTGVPLLVIPVVVIFYTLGQGGTYGVEPAYFAELFPARLRYSGISIATQLVTIIAGGLAPTIATLLLAAGGGQPWLVSLYVILAGAITLATALIAPETAPRVLARRSKVQPVAQPAE